MGMYGGDIIFPQAPPVSILRWGIMTWLITDLDDLPERMSITILVPPDGTEIARLEAEGLQPPPRVEEATKLTFRTFFVLPPTNFTEEGFVEAMVETEKGVIRAGRLFVRFLPPGEGATTSASDEPLPPVRSPPDVQDSSSLPEPSRPARPTRRRRS